MIKERLLAAAESGKLEAIEKQVKARVTHNAMHPKTLSTIGATSIDRKYYFDPTITVDEDIKDHKGVVIHHKEKRLNPLHYVSWRAPMMFINGEDEDQLKWALNEHESHRGKIVLVKGTPIELYRKYGVRFYFDQAGKITSQFDIRHVPARVSQDGERLLIECLILKKEKSND